MRNLATVAAFGFADFDPSVMLALYRRIGCTSCQFYRNEGNPPTDQHVIETCRDAQLAIDSIHGVFGPSYDPSSPDEDHRRAAMETYRSEGELAIRLGGPMVVVHPAPRAPEGVLISNTHRRQHYDPLMKSMRELAEIGRELSVTYLIENVPDNYWIGNDPIALTDMIRAVDSPNLRMCFDLGHAQMTGNVTDHLLACRDVIAYLHVNDNDGVNDSHLMPGDGVIDWELVRGALDKAKLNSPAMLEVFYLAEQVGELVESDVPEKLAYWLCDSKTPRTGAQAHPAG